MKCWENVRFDTWGHRTQLVVDPRGVTITTFAPNHVVMYGPLGDEPLTGRDAVLEAMRGIGGAADLTYREVLTGETHHATFCRLEIDDTAVDGMDYM